MKKITFVVPIYKEKENFVQYLEKIIEIFRIAQITFELILILDKVALDNTHQIARKVASKHPEMHLFIRKGRLGVGTAIRQGISLADGDVVIPVMADGSESPNDLLSMALMSNKGFDMVVGNRFLEKKIFDYQPLKYCVNRLCNFFTKIFFRIPTSDITNACKAYSVSCIKELELKSKGYAIFLELPVKAYFNSNRHLAEISITHYAKPKPHGLKVFRDGLQYLLTFVNMLVTFGLRKHKH